jgi:hypothetical protein
VEAAAAEGSKELLSSSGNTNASQKYLGKGKIVHGRSCSGEEYKSSFECWRMLGDSQSEVACRVFCTFFAGS